MAIQFRKAEKRQAKARIGIVGPSGAGKTYTALTLAKALGENVFLIDSENKSSDYYADEFDFVKCDLDSFRPRVYVEAIKAAEAAGADVIIVDSLSHAWAGADGALNMADEATARNKGNKWAAWREVTPDHNLLVETIVRCKAHIICTMRAKTAWETTKDEKGRTVPVKIGLAPVQRDGMEYEFDVVADMDHVHNFVVSKTRIRTLDNLVIKEPDESLGGRIREWLETGAASEVAEKPEEAQAVDTEDEVEAPRRADQSVATDEQVKEVYAFGKNALQLAPNQLKAALKRVTGKESTTGLSVDELQAWEREINRLGAGKEYAEKRSNGAA